MCALYAFLRHTDDLADEAASVVHGRPRRSMRGGSSSTLRWRAGSVTGRAFPPWPTRLPATEFRRICSMK